MDERQPLLSNGEAVYYDFDDTGKHKIVDFHPKGDAENPLDWPKRYRWFVVLLLAFMAFTVYDPTVLVEGSN
jgi:hypothetical protein